MQQENPVKFNPPKHSTNETESTDTTVHTCHTADRYSILAKWLRLGKGKKRNLL